jgi:hypothetical protein
MRSRSAQLVFFFSKSIGTSRKKLSRRREWRQLCENAKDYDQFKKIRIMEATTTTATEGVATPSSSPINQTSPLRKSRSFATMETLREEKNRPQGYNVQQTDSNDDEDDVMHVRSNDYSDSSTTKNTSSSPGNRSGKIRRQSSLTKLKTLQEEQAKYRHGIPSDQCIAIEKDLGPSTTDLLLSTTYRLNEERTKLMQGEESGLEFLLSGVVKRNHLALEDSLVSNARSVAVSGQYEFSAATRKAIDAYYSEVSKGLQTLTKEQTLTNSLSSSSLSELQNRIRLLRKMKQNMGRTALMLSGGGAQAMYHLGTIRALIQSKLYQDIKVISGTSGGSIAAACCAMFTPEQIFEGICVSTVSTDFRLTGEMKKRNIRWFPPLVSLMSTFFKSLL